MTYLDIFLAELKMHEILWCQRCELYNSHTRGFVTKDPVMVLGQVVRETKTIHLSSAIATRRTLHRGLHEIGHLVNDERGMKRWEKEEAANRYAENRMREIGIPVPRVEAAKGRRYVGRMRRWGGNISKSRETLMNSPETPEWKKYVVHVTWRDPAWDEKGGADIETEARSKADACKYVRRQMRDGGHTGVMYFKATEVPNES